MPHNFIACDRDQSYLLPPSLLDWVPADHVVWTILSSVDEMDLSAFYSDYRADGHGRPAYEPAMMVALLLYSYAKGNRSSRGIERACREDVVYRVICTNLVPDHSTIAEFRRRHEKPLAELFTSVLSLCKEAGLVNVGVIAIDGTKVKANASRDQNKTYERIVREILAEADAIDRAEDEQFGDARGDEVPEQLRTPEGRRAALRAAKERLARKRERGELDEEEPESVAEGPELESDARAIVARVDGREGGLPRATPGVRGHRPERSDSSQRDRHAVAVARLVLSDSERHAYGRAATDGARRAHAKGRAPYHLCPALAPGLQQAPTYSAAELGSPQWSTRRIARPEMDSGGGGTCPPGAAGTHCALVLGRWGRHRGRDSAGRWQIDAHATKRRHHNAEECWPCRSHT